MALILAFDSWTGGLRNYKRISPALRLKGFQLLLIHTGSWGVDPGRPDEEVADDILVRDVRYYKDERFSEILAREKPDAVLFLSCSTFSHRAFNRYCIAKSIPTVLLYHGLMSVLSTENQKAYSKNLVSHSIFVLKRGVKMLTRVWPIYLKSLLDTKASYEDWMGFFNSNWKLLIGSTSLPKSVDQKTDICLIYTDGDREHAKTTHGFEDRSIFSVGNPDLLMFGMSNSYMRSAPDYRNSNEILYIDTAMLARGAVFSSIDDCVLHFVNTRNILKSAGYNLVVKLHPDQYRTDIPDKLVRNGLILCENNEFIARISSSRAALVEPSSAAVLPALVGLPLLLVKYSKFKNQPYGPILESYPMAAPLYEIEHIDRVMASLESSKDPLAISEWIELQKGPDAEEMPSKVANLICELANRRLV